MVLEIALTGEIDCCTLAIRRIFLKRAGRRDAAECNVGDASLATTTKKSAFIRTPAFRKKAR
jgi:hypothetical protein